MVFRPVENFGFCSYEFRIGLAVEFQPFIKYRQRLIFVAAVFVDDDRAVLSAAYSQVCVVPRFGEC